MTLLADLSTDQLADGICLRAARIAAATAELLQWVAEFDRRGGWAGPGMLSCAHWLAWRTGLSPGAAREQVRVARRLEELPEVAEAFGQGQLSYSKVRAVTRAAREDDGVDWVGLARAASAAQLEKVVRGIARARFEEAADRDPALRRAAFRTRVRYDEHGNFTMTIKGPPDLLPVVQAGLEAEKAQLARERAAKEEGRTAGTTTGSAADDHAAADAEALLALAQDVLVREQQDQPTAARRRRTRLTVLVDPLSGWARLADGELLPPASLRGVLRSLPGRGQQGRLLPLPPLRPLRDVDLRRADLGRTHREVSLQLRDLLGELDGERCRFPGCTRIHRLHAHHVRYWSDGGPTDLANLVLVCARHHTLVHAQGFQLALHPDRRLEVRTADGVPVLHHPGQPRLDGAPLDGPDVSAETLSEEQRTARLDLDYAVGVLLQQAA